MTRKRLGIMAMFAVVGLMIYATHTYEEHQAYKTGVYIGKTIFTADDYQNRTCLSVRQGPPKSACDVKDLNQDSVMEDALASANIIPALAGSTALHAGFRDGWRQARTAASADR